LLDDVRLDILTESCVTDGTWNQAGRGTPTSYYEEQLGSCEPSCASAWRPMAARSKAEDRRVSWTCSMGRPRQAARVVWPPAQVQLPSARPQSPAMHTPPLRGVRAQKVHHESRPFGAATVSALLVARTSFPQRRQKSSPLNHGRASADATSLRVTQSVLGPPPRSGRHVTDVGGPPLDPNELGVKVEHFLEDKVLQLLLRQ